VVEQPSITSFIIPSQEEMKLIVDQLAPTQTQLDNKTKININAMKHRCRHRPLAQMFNEETNKENQNLNLIVVIEKEENETSMYIILHLLVGINLDDDDIAKIYDEVYNELNTLFTSSMSLFDGYSMKSV
jgi:hypothetical protein